MDVDAVEKIMGFGMFIHSVKLSAFIMREKLEKRDGSGEIESFSELSKDEKRMKEILFHLEDHLNKIQCSLSLIERPYEDMF